MQIIVLGMHRSGTSATARLINMMGAYFAPEGVSMGANQYNPKGFWERQDMMRINDNLLKFQNCRWHDLANWSFERAPVVPVEMRHPMQKLVLEMDAHRPWFTKDPRLCLTLPAWLPCLEVPVAVLVYRNPLEIALSLQRRDRLLPAYALALWEYYAVGMLNATRELPHFFMQYAELLKNPVQTCQSIYNYLTAQKVQRLAMPGEREIMGFIDPALYRARGNRELRLSPHQLALAELMQNARTQKKEVEVSEESKAIIRAGVPG